MTIAVDAYRYNTVARALHWIIGILVIANLALGVLHDPLEHTWNVIPLHKSIGLTVLILSVIRIGWRFTYKVPDWPDTMGQLQKVGAKLTHLALYVLILVMPLTGWVFSSAGKYPIAMWGIPWPKLPVTKGMAIVGFTHEAHEILGFAMIALVLLHIAAAFHHHHMIKDDVLRRML